MWASPKGRVFSCFSLNFFYYHFGLKLDMFFTLAWHWTFCLQGTIFSRQHCYRSQMFTQMKTISGWLPHIIEPCSNFRGPKLGIDFWLRSEIGYGKSQILVGNRVQVSGFGPLIANQNFREYHPGTRINKSMLKQKITLIFLHISNSNSSMLNLLNKMDQEKKNSENRFIVQCTLYIYN